MKQSQVIFTPKKWLSFSKSKQQRRIRVRAFLLLEILISFFLIVFCALPLFYPHTYILQQEKSFIKTIELDRAVTLFFCELLEKLYQNEIPWTEIEAGEEREITSSLFKYDRSFEEKLLSKGRYRFSILRSKETTESKEFLLALTIAVPHFGERSLERTFEEYSYFLVVTKEKGTGNEM